MPSTKRRTTLTQRPGYQACRQQLAGALAAHRPGDAVAAFLQSVGPPAGQIKGMRHAPIWPKFEAVTPTLAHDAAALGEERAVPTQRAANVGVPALVMNGTVIPFMTITAKALAAAIPHAQHRTLESQSHDVKPEVLSPVLVECFGS